MRGLMAKTRIELFSLAVALAFLHWCGGGRVAGQETKHDREAITAVEARAVISVEFEIHATDRSVMVPHCGEGVSGNFFTCYGAAYLEVLSGETWERAKPPKDMMATLGTPSRDDWRPTVITPAVTRHFVFVFDPVFFGVKRGDHLRIKVPAWSNRESMGDRDPDTTFVSPVFNCP